MYECCARSDRSQQVHEVARGWLERSEVEQSSRKGQWWTPDELMEDRDSIDRF